MTIAFTQMVDAGQARMAAALKQESGQGLAEYALVLFFIAVVSFLAVIFLGTVISSFFSSIGANI